MGPLLGKTRRLFLKTRRLLPVTRRLFLKTRCLFLKTRRLLPWVSVQVSVSASDGCLRACFCR